MSKIVRYNNDLNSIVFPSGGLNEIELKVFFAIIYCLADQGSEDVTLSFDYIKELTKEKKHYTKAEYARVIHQVYHKLVHLSFYYKNEHAQGEVNIFQSYEQLLSDDSFTISVAPKFQYMFNELIQNGSFTAWELEEFCSITGNYAKNLYRLLKQWKFIGRHAFDIEEITMYLGVPASYGTKEIMRRVINPSVNTLRKEVLAFETLNVETIKKGKKIVRLLFTWKPEIRKNRKGQRLWVDGSVMDKEVPEINMHQTELKKEETDHVSQEKNSPLEEYLKRPSISEAFNIGNIDPEDHEKL